MHLIEIETETAQSLYMWLPIFVRAPDKPNPLRVSQVEYQLLFLRGSWEESGQHFPPSPFCEGCSMWKRMLFLRKVGAENDAIWIIVFVSVCCFFSL